MQLLNITTKQIMSVCFAIREVIVTDQEGTVNLVWRSCDDGANKPQNTRPLALFPAKESQELLKDFVPLVEGELHAIMKE